MTLDYFLIGWSVLFILNIIVGLVDFLQSGIAWPLNLTAAISMLILKRF